MQQRPVRSGSAFRQSLCSPVLDDYWRDVVGMRVWPWTWADPRVHHPAVDADLEACAGVRVATPVRGHGTRSGAIHIREFLRHLNCGALCWAFLVEPKPQVVAAAGPAGDDVERLNPGSPSWPSCSYSWASSFSQYCSWYASRSRKLKSSVTSSSPTLRRTMKLGTVASFGIRR